ncbi:MAG: PAS domain S-box protein [Spirochaetes bacterium]|nr:PAS domain S-box protein [Spirochaetota bacterium]
MKELRILILEDNPNDSKLINRTLADSGLEFTSKCVGTEEEFERILDEYKPTLILADYRLPSAGGMTALLHAKSKAPAVPFIIVSDTVGEELAAEALNAGAEDYVLKDELLNLAPLVKRAIGEIEKRPRKRSPRTKNNKDEGRFRKLADSIGSGVAVFKPVDEGNDFIFVDINKAACMIERVIKKEVIGRSVRDLFPGVGEFGLLEVLRRVWNTGVPEHHPASYYHDDRIEGWRENYVYRLPSGEIVAVYDDITEKKRIEEELKKSEERFRAIAERSFDAIFIVTREGEIEYVSPAIERIIGFSPKELAGRRFLEFVPQEEHTKANGMVSGILAGRIVEGFLLTMQKKDRTAIYIEVNASPIREGEEVKGIQGAIRDITERVRMEEECRMLARFPSENPNPVIRVSKEGTVLYANKASDRVLSYWRCGIGDAVPPRFRSVITDSFEQGTVTKIEAECGEFVCAFTIAPFVEGGYINLYGLDVTEQKRAQERISLLSSAVEQTSEGIAISDLKGNLLFVNNAFARIHGCSVEELQGKNISVLHTDEQMESVKEANRVLVEKGEFTGEVWHTRKSGEVFPTLMQNSVLRDENNQAVGLIGTLRDITGRKMEEQELRTLSLAVHQSPVSIMITDREGIIEYVNRRFEEITGYRYGEALGRNPRLLKSGEHNLDFYKELWDTITQGKSWQGEFHNRRKNGELFWESAAISPIKNDEGEITHFLGIKEDITRHKVLEQQLIHSQKMEAIGTLAGGIAHDFNNMLSVIIGYSDFLLMQIPEDDRKHGIIKEIRKSGTRAANIAQQLLAFSRKQMLAKHIVDLNAVVTDMNKMLKRLISEDIELTTRFAKGLWPVHADRVQMEQVVMNLVINARDAMPKGGRISIITGNVTVDEEYCRRYPYARTGDYISLAVTDTGIGMSRQTAERIFDPFFTTKETGTGLGLSVVYGIVKQHGGWINTESEEGSGTTFVVYIPASAESQEGSEEKTARVEELAGRGERILLVEDDRILREFTVNVLRQNGYTVFEAENAEQALDIYTLEKGKFALLFSDVVLPNLSGVELAGDLLDRDPKLPVLLSSGYMDGKAQWEVIEEKGYKFIQKPYSLKNLLSRIKDAVRGG